MGLTLSTPISWASNECNPIKKTSPARERQKVWEYERCLCMPYFVISSLSRRYLGSLYGLKSFISYLITIYSAI